MSEVAGLIPDGVPAALWHESTQPLTEMCTGNVFWGLNAADMQG